MQNSPISVTRKLYNTRLRSHKNSGLFLSLPESAKFLSFRRTLLCKIPELSEDTAFKIPELSEDTAMYHLGIQLQALGVLL